jgi:hypothetical protein
MSDAPPIIHRSLPGISPEQARDARARAWAFVFDCYTRKKAARPGSPDDVRKDQDAHTAKKQYT